MSCNPIGESYKPEWAGVRSNIVVGEKAVKYVGQNLTNKNFSLFRIDNYVISDKTKAKCDFLLIRCDDSHCFFIELKGSDLVHASHQIIETIKELKTRLKGHILNARIVLTRTATPDLTHLNLIKLKRLVEATGGNLKRENRQLQEIH